MNQKPERIRTQKYRNTEAGEGQPSPPHNAHAFRFETPNAKKGEQ